MFSKNSIKEQNSITLSQYFYTIKMLILFYQGIWDLVKKKPLSVEKQKFVKQGR